MMALFKIIKQFLFSDFYPYVSLQFFRYGLIIAIIIFAAFGPLDWMLIEDEVSLYYITVIRVIAIIAVFCITLIVSYNKKFNIIQPTIAFCTALLVCIAIILIDSILIQSNNKLELIYFAGLALVITLAPTVMWLNFFYSILFNLIVLLTYNFLVAENSNYSNALIIDQNLVLISASVFGTFCRLSFMILIKSNIEKTIQLSKEKELVEQANEKLEASDKIKQKILSILSHDIRVPLRNIHSMLALQKRGLVSREEFDEHLDGMKGAVKATNNLLENILAWSKIQLDRKSDKASISIFDLVEENFLLVKPNADEKNITLKNEVNRELWVEVHYHTIALVLRNLIANAIKFTEEGAITITADTSAGLLTVTVTDTGTGMISSVAQTLLDGNKKFTTEGTRNEKGSGLGLLMSKELLQEQGGILYFITEHKKGSAFSFTIPATIPLMVQKDSGVVTF